MNVKVEFGIGTSLVLSYLLLWFRSVHELLHASDTLTGVKILIPYPNQEFGNIFFLYARNQKEKTNACMLFLCLILSNPQSLSYTKR